MDPEPPELSAYAGRWVALAGGQVVGQGLSEAEARLAAQLARPKESFRVMHVSLRPPLQFSDVFERVRALLPAGIPVWLVGGTVRDALLRRETHDLDFAVQGDALALARKVAASLGAVFFPLDDERETGRVILELPDGSRENLDFARLRTPDLLSDLKARDFTLNAIAVNVQTPDELIDPLNGEADLRTGLLRACGPTSISDDPARCLRAIRLAAQLDFRIEKSTREQIRAQAGTLGRVSAERVRDEFLRILGGRKPASALRALDALGLLSGIVPEVQPMKGCAQPAPHIRDVWEHTLLAVEKMEDLLGLLGPVHDPDAAADLTLGLATVRLGRFRPLLDEHLFARLSDERPARALLVFSTLMHDSGKPQTRSVDEDGRIRFFGHEDAGAGLASGRANALRLANAEVARIRATVQNHMRPLLLAQSPPITRRAIYRFFRDAGPAGVEVVLLSLADTLATYGHTLPQPVWQGQVETAFTLLAGYYETREQSVSPPALLDGSDLMNEFQLPQGRLIGQLLEEVREAQAAGELQDREAAIEFVRRRLAES